MVWKPSLSSWPHLLAQMVFQEGDLQMDTVLEQTSFSSCALFISPFLFGLGLGVSAASSSFQPLEALTNLATDLCCHCFRPPEMSLLSFV